VTARALASADFTAALPGKAWLDRGPDEPDGAYAIFTLEKDGEPEFESDGTYLQGYTLRMAAYTVAGRENTATPQEAQLAMVAALNANPTTWDALRDGRVNVCLPRGYDGKHAPELREGKDVFAAAGQWHLLIEGNIEP
jgi:hypothetical protein